jgi:hypothetical protein
MTTLHSFIISWEGQHQRAATIAESIESQSDHTTIVYSDPDPLFSFDASRDALRRPNDLMFGDKFHACLDHCRSDVLLLIHADCECETWPELVQSCRNAFDGLSDVNLWAPSIGYTRYSVGVTELSRLPHSNLSIVAATDAIIVGFRSSTIDRLKRCDLNKTLLADGSYRIADRGEAQT